jgi:hypothetical protein
MEKQKTIEGDWVDVVGHPDDMVVCQCGKSVRRGDAFMDYSGGYWSNDDDRLEIDTEIVHEWFNTVCKAQEEYYTENSDYADSFPIEETKDEWLRGIENYLGDNYTSDLGEFIYSELDSYDGEWEYIRNEYSPYYGDGCALFSFSLDELEEQFSIDDHGILSYFHKRGELESMLASYNGDMYINSRRECVKGEGYTGKEYYVDQHGCFYGYVCPGGRWHFVIPKDRIEEIISLRTN